MVVMPELLILGGVVLVGVIGKLIFSKTHIPESLYLIFVGMLLGPILGLLQPDFFRENMSFFVTVALIIVLIDSGLKLDLNKIVKTTLSSIIFTLTVGLLTTIFVASFLHLAFDWSLFNATFLGIIVSGTTTVTISHLIERLTIDQKTVVTDTKTILFVESVLSDIIVIGAAAILLGIAGGVDIDGRGLATMLFNTFFVGSLTGFMLGVLWAFLYVWKLHGNKLSYLFTLGIAFCIYSAVEFVGLNGALTVAVFSLVVGNHQVIIDVFRVKAKFFKEIEKDVTAMKKTDTEFTFLITTFFFVVLGIIFSIEAMLSPLYLSIAGGVILLKLLARYITSLLLGKANGSFKRAKVAHTTLMSCGLASALVAFLAIDANLGIPGLAEIVVMLIILTTLVAIVGTWIQEKLTASAQANTAEK